MGTTTTGKKGKPGLAKRILLFVAFAAACLAGCADPYTMYQVPVTYVAEGKKILIMPFMDTRTLLVKNDPHNADLGFYARDIFTEALRGRVQALGAVILTPDMSRPPKSLTNAEVAEIGRAHGADVVIAGQIFSFTDTRAASIPARAGMFVRVIASDSGALLFAGDHYHAATVPVAGGNRDQQARIVAARLVDGMMTHSVLAGRGGVASGRAFAMLTPVTERFGFRRRAVGNNRNRRSDSGETPPLPGLVGNSAGTQEWDENLVPEAPPILDAGPGASGSGQPPPPEETTPKPPPVAATGPEPEAKPDKTKTADTAPAAVHQPEPAPETKPEPEPAPVAATPPPPAPPAPSPAPEPAATVADAVPAPAADAAAAQPAVTVAETPPPPALPVDPVTMEAAAKVIDELPELDRWTVESTIATVDAHAAVVSHLADMSGDDLASDLFESDGNVFPAEPEARQTAVRPGLDIPRALTPGEISGDGALYSFLELDPETQTIKPVAPGAVRPAPVTAADPDNGPLYSTPMAVEQPRTYKLVNLDEDPSLARQDESALVATPGTGTGAGAVRILILPYHDRPNDHNLIPNTGGGEVVTTLYGTQLALDPGIRLMWDATGMATHDRLPDREEAIELGRLAGADYVMRGQVVEFRRAQSVPSFYSVVISTAVLAAQVFLAEMSGVDVATEVYRVRDGMCVMSRRDRAQQKYVVQAEKTVRRLAIGMTDSVSRAIRSPSPEEMDPLIDELRPVTVLSNPR